LILFFKSVSGQEKAATGGQSATARKGWSLSPLVGTPEQVVEQILNLRRAGCDGIQVNFFDYLPDIARFADKILPLLQAAGVRREAAPQER
jgi:FMNH2-dependent dimethyl sulfone monooxygenase